MPLCPIHKIPMQHRGAPDGPLCRICHRRHVRRNSKSRICLDCQIKLHLQSASAARPRPERQLFACPACLGSHRSERATRARRRNGRRGGVPMTRERCRLCQQRELAVTNTSGICRRCTRLYGTATAQKRAQKAQPAAIA